MRYTLFDSILVRFSLHTGKKSEYISQKIRKSTENMGVKSEAKSSNIVTPVYLLYLIKSDHQEISNKRSRIQLLKITFMIIQVRGLTRWIFRNLAHSKLITVSEISNMSRTKLFFFLVRNRQIWMRAISPHIFYGKLTKNDYSKAKKVYLNDFLQYHKKFRIKNDSVYLLENSNRIKVKVYNNQFSSNFLGKFAQKNPRQLIDYLTRFDYPAAILNELKEEFPFLYDELTTKIVIRYEFLPNSDKSFDDIVFGYSSEEKTWIKLSNIEIWHQRFIMSHGKWLIPDVAMNPTRHFVGGQWQFVKSLKNESDRCIIRRPSGKKIEIKSGILLASRLDENWFHLIMDSLPRLYFMRKVPAKVPLIIRDDLPRTSRTFLEKFAGRELIEIPSESVVNVQSLYTVSARSVIFDSNLMKSDSIPAYSSGTILKVRNWIVNQSNLVLQQPKQGGKFFVSREAKHRNLQNQESLEKTFESQGFSIKKTNDSFFRRQISFFANADVVATPGGAMLANIIFMDSKSTIVILRSFRNDVKNIWRELAQIVGVNCIEIKGIPLYIGANKLRRVHSDFYVSHKRVLSKLSSLNP
jgi:hypothetical protein